MRGIRAPTVRRVALFALAVPLLLILFRTTSREPSTTADELEAACERGEPYLVTPCYYGLARSTSRGVYDPAAVSVALFNDTANNRPHYELADFEAVGTVWGLAYDDRAGHVYAGAYHKRQLPFGSLGPGGVYRINLDSGAVDPFVTVPDAGRIHHEDPIRRTDDIAERWVGRTSLGDLELNAAADTLFVMNMHVQEIFRYELPSGKLIDSFPHGAMNAPWADQARPMALAWHDGHLYHGVVRTAEFTRDRTELAGFVYRSRSDGSDMTLVAEIPLDYRRGFVRPSVYLGGSLRVDWQVWRDNFAGRTHPELDLAVYPQPLLSDIAFDEAGNMILGLRDRRTDTSPHYVKLRRIHNLAEVKPRLLQLGFGMGVGDVLLGRPEGDGWTFDVKSEHYDDYSAALGDESAQGGLAEVKTDDQVIAGSYANNSYRGTLFYSEGFYWYDNPSGEKASSELVCDPVRFEPYQPGLQLANPVGAHSERPLPSPTPPRPTPGPGVTPDPVDREFRAPASVGDVEAICAVDRPTPTPTPTDMPPTATNAPPTVTPTVTRTPTATPTVTSEPAHVYLPILINDPRCKRGYQNADAVLVVDASTSMLEPTASGRLKLDVVREALRGMLDHFSLEAGDRVALVTFNQQSRLVQPLTDDRAALEAALQRIDVATQTRMQLGLAEAYSEFVTGARASGPGRNKMAILITDGRNNPEPAAVAVAEAERLKSAGVGLATVGIGHDLDREALAAMVDRPERYFEVERAEDLHATLEQVYRSVAYAVPCPPEIWWPYRE